VSKVVKVLMALVMVTVLLVSVTGTVLANQRVEGDPYGIEVSPNVLNIDSYAISGNIHSNIPKNDNLTGVALTVDGQDIAEFGMGIDDLGHLVIKFDMGDVKAILDDGAKADFAVSFTYAGDSYIVYDSVDVIYPSK